jgi:hypothetical protein
LDLAMSMDDGLKIGVERCDRWTRRLSDKQGDLTILLRQR